jgi:hypothetical protein
MLVFESLSGGVLAILVVFALVLVVTGVYLIAVWPLTFWDLANLGLENIGPWIDTILLSLFAGGTLAGYYVFSGAAFKPKQKARVPASSKSHR